MCTNECCMKAFDIITLLCSDNMEQLGKYQIPSGYKRRQNIDRILFYYNFDPRVQRDYISFLQTEREFEVKYRNRVFIISNVTYKCVLLISSESEIKLVKCP